ncbi:MAG TPA: hypothetical protein VGD14_14005, partial [bacterium]
SLCFFGKKIFKHEATRKPQGHKERLKRSFFFVFVCPPWRMSALYLCAECFFLLHRCAMYQFVVTANKLVSIHSKSTEIKKNAMTGLTQIE